MVLCNRFFCACLSKVCTNWNHRGQPWRTNSTEDAEAVERNAAFYIGMFSEPVYGSGDWPELMKQALNESILPRFTDEEKAEIKGTQLFTVIELTYILTISLQL